MQHDVAAEEHRPASCSTRRWPRSTASPVPARSWLTVRSHMYLPTCRWCDSRRCSSQYLVQVPTARLPAALLTCGMSTWVHLVIIGAGRDGGAIGREGGRCHVMRMPLRAQHAWGCSWACCTALEGGTLNLCLMHMSCLSLNQQHHSVGGRHAKPLISSFIFCAPASSRDLQHSFELPCMEWPDRMRGIL